MVIVIMVMFDPRCNIFIQDNMIHWMPNDVGCCGECFTGFKKMRRQKDHMTKHSVANGMIFGEPPGALTNLNDVKFSAMSLVKLKPHQDGTVCSKMTSTLLDANLTAARRSQDVFHQKQCHTEQQRHNNNINH